MEEQRLKKHIVLVHGMGHGAWCWYKVATLLRSAGYRVTAPDLAASGVDRRLLENVASFAEYTQPLTDVMRSLPADERVVLVGHSLGGISIAMAMEQFPEKIAAAVFLTAFLPDSSSSPSYVIDKHATSKIVCLAVDPKWVGNIPLSFWMDTKFGQVKRPSSVLFGPDFMASGLYHVSPSEDLTLGTTLVRPGSLFQEDLSSLPAFSESGYGSVDAVYVACCEDRTITIDVQRWMVENYRVKEVMELKEADHMPMFSTPKELCQCLIGIAEAHV